MEQAVLDAMPEPGVLRSHTSDGRVWVMRANRLLYQFDADDAGMRNLAIVALTEAGERIDEVAGLFGLSPTYVSILRGRARREGSAGLVRHRGRPPKLTAGQVSRARRWAGAGWTQQQIAQKLGVARSVISELLAKHGPASGHEELALGAGAPAGADQTGQAEAGEADQASGGHRTEEAGEESTEQAVEAVPGTAADGQTPGESVGAGSSRVGTGRFGSRYAGAMLLYPYLHRVGAEAVFATVTGAPARRYDDAAVLSTATLGFALGAGTVEGAKYLRRTEAGPAVGIKAVPELRTLRTRLGALAECTDPLAVQRAFAAGMLAADPAADPVYFVDDHFVPYAGARPVAKGWNTKRRTAEPGRDDTHLVDARGRAVVFGSSEPTGLSTTLPDVLAQLRTVIGPDAPVLLGFDRGGAYPVTVTACRAAGADWVTYRRAPLAATSAEPARTTTIRDGRSISMVLADQTVHLTGYGDARQLTLYENEVPVLQVLTSETGADGAHLLCWLRARWRIENMFKYAGQHNGIDALADYRMDIEPDPRKVPNPARAAARKHVKAAEAELAAAERALPQLLDGPDTPKQKNAALPGAHQRIRHAQAALAQAKTALRPIPAKIAATELDPQARRARPHLARRGLQMVLPLLAFNAEAWLAEHLNAYLADPDEYRAITRHLLHQGGQIDYTPTAITVTLDRPDTPRIARALALLLDELNTEPAHLPGDSRPLTYHLAEH